MIEAGRFRVEMSARTTVFQGVREGADETDVSRSIADGLRTRVVASAAQLQVGYWLTKRWGASVTGSLEERTLVNRTFPPEGKGGERRQDAVRGFGDVRALGSWMAWDSDGGRRRLVFAAGVALPTGPVRPDRLVGPTDATLQLGSGIVAPLAAMAFNIDVSAVGRVDLDVTAVAPAYENRYGYQPGKAAVLSATLARTVARRLIVGGGCFTSWKGLDERRGLAIQNSGGETLGGTLRAGMAISQFDVAVEGRVPLYRYVNGVQLVESWGAALTLAWSGRVSMARETKAAP